MPDNEKIIPEVDTDQRLFTMVYYDFLESKLLNYYEKMIFIMLKKHAGKDTQKSYPSLATLSKETGISKRKVQNCLKHMKELGVIEIQRRKTENGDPDSNLYIVHDYRSMWTTKENEKDLADASTTKHQQSPQNSNISKPNNTEKIEKSQVIERHSEEWIMNYYEFDDFKTQNPTKESEIDDIIHILHTILNTDSPTIKVNGEEKPTMIVVRRMLRLTQDMILYVINQYNEQTRKIKNPTAYITTCLYNVHEQYNLALRNQVAHDLAHYED